MALRLTLKPDERIIVGGAVIRNGGANKIQFMVENEVPVLREADIMSPKDAKTPCQRIYLALNLMYVDEAKRREHTLTYRALAAEVLEAAPSTSQFLIPIDDSILEGRYYEALKRTRDLLAYEQELFASAG